MATRLRAFQDYVQSPAVGAAIVTADGLADVATLGVCNIDGDDAVRDDDAWHIGSCTKSISALAWAQLVEAGQASWAPPLAEIFEDVDCHVGFHNVTMTDLLQCRAGLPANPGFLDNHRSHRDTRPLVAQRTGVAERLLTEAPQRPGIFVYSNLSYILLGAAIDRIGESSYEETIAQTILSPLGIGDAGFGPPPRIVGHKPGVSLGRKGFSRPLWPMGIQDNAEVFNSAGRLHLSLASWAKVIGVILSGGAPLVSADSLSMLTTPPATSDFAMGWGRQATGSLVMQGSNTVNAATVVIDTAQGRAALVVANESRDRTLEASARFAEQLLASTR